MIVVIPTNTNHIVKVIPRFYPSDEITVELYNETNKEKTIVANNYIVVDGNIFFDFDYTFTDGQKFQIKIYNSTGVIFRGKLIATSQTPQNFKQTNNLYTYYE